MGGNFRHDWGRIADSHNERLFDSPENFRLQTTLAGILRLFFGASHGKISLSELDLVTGRLDTMGQYAEFTRKNERETVACVPEGILRRTAEKAYRETEAIF